MFTFFGGDLAALLALEVPTVEAQWAGLAQRLVQHVFRDSYEPIPDDIRLRVSRYQLTRGFQAVTRRANQPSEATVLASLLLNRGYTSSSSSSSASQ